MLNFSFLQKLNKKDIVWLVLIIALASFFRLYQLGSTPHGFHNDEIMNGYVGRFILETGKDLYGNAYPIKYFNNFGDYPNVIPMYISGFFTYIFGVNEFAVRFPIALAGILTVGLMFYICRWLFENKTVAILTSLSLIILPWHLVLSRATAEGITATFIFLLGFTLVFKALDQKSWTNFIAGDLLLLSTYLLYPGFRVLTPVASLVIVWLAFKSNFKLFAIGSALFFFIVTGLISQTEWGRGRYEQTSIFTFNNVIKGKALRYATGLGSGHVFEARFFHNKLILVGQEFMRQYSFYFSPSFWFMDIGKPDRYVVPEHGQLLYSLAIIIILAILIQFFKPLKKIELDQLFNNKRSRFFLGYLWLLLISPISAALTLDDTPNIHRTALTGVLLMFLVAYSLAIILKSIKKNQAKKVFIVILLATLSFEGLIFWHYYTRLSRYTTMLVRNERERSLAQWLITHQQEYDQIFVSNVSNQPLYYLFYKKDFSSALAGQFAEKMKISQLDNINFFEQNCAAIDEKYMATALVDDLALIVGAECQVPSYYKQVDEIVYINGLQAFAIYIPDRIQLNQGKKSHLEY